MACSLGVKIVVAQRSKVGIKIEEPHIIRVRLLSQKQELVHQLGIERTKSEHAWSKNNIDKPLKSIRNVEWLPSKGAAKEKGILKRYTLQRITTTQ